MNNVFYITDRCVMPEKWESIETIKRRLALNVELTDTLRLARAQRKTVQSAQELLAECMAQVERVKKQLEALC